ncbi:MAG: DUF4258 domain-containing protein [Candidatus Hydrogenedentes bacterium]|nr:DUF4258 domain-containing protein [Candidatus Hydrogenedentota bacterium]
MENDVTFTFRVHAVLRMAERCLNRKDIESAIRAGEVIERYDGDLPFPSRLFLSTANARPLHVVAAWNEVSREWIVITAYEPSIERWYPDYKRRRP